jgi:hypothetical protein
MQEAGRSFGRLGWNGRDCRDEPSRTTIDLGWQAGGTSTRTAGVGVAVDLAGSGTT